jgi:hypothetical protein
LIADFPAIDPILYREAAIARLANKGKSLEVVSI